MKVWVVDWSDCEDGWIQPEGKTYHKSEAAMNKFIDKIVTGSKGMTPTSKKEVEVKVAPVYEQFIGPLKANN